MTNIYDYTDIEKPHLNPVAKMPHPTKDKAAGLVCVVPKRDEERGYVSKRSYGGAERHFFEKGDGYCITDDILRKLTRYNVKFVYIQETDRKNVWEFNINSFLQGMEVNEMDEPQHCAPLGNAVKCWEDHADDLVQQ